MTDEEYSMTQQKIIGIYQFIQTCTETGLDIGGFLERMSKAHAVGPILCPTAYRDALPNMQLLAEMARALKPAAALVQKIREEHHGVD